MKPGFSNVLGAQLALFGRACASTRLRAQVAWSECGDAHESDMTGFRPRTTTPDARDRARPRAIAGSVRALACAISPLALASAR